MQPKQAEVVVIGGGVLGTSAAFHLADAGQRGVVLLDRGPIAGGTTPQAAGQTGYLNTDPFALEFGSYCIDFFENFEQRTGYPINFRQSGSLRVALTEKYQADLQHRSQAAQPLGHGVEFISCAEAKRRVPTFEPPNDCRILSIPRDGYVEPTSVAIAYAAAARDRGVAIQTRCEVTEVKVADGRVEAVCTPDGWIETRWIVLAAGAWTRQLGQSLGLNLCAIPVRHQAIETAPMKGVLAEQPIVRITEPQIYVRQEAAGLLVGGYGYRPMSFDMNDFPNDFEIPALEADQVYYQQLTAAAREFFPSLGDAIVTRERRGLPTMAPDGRLLVSQSKQIHGLVVASACGVGGVDRSPGVGRLVAEIVTGKTPWIDPAVLNVDRFGDTCADEVALREQCVEKYAHHYHEVY